MYTGVFDTAMSYYRSPQPDLIGFAKRRAPSRAIMQKYQIRRTLGEGSFAVVYEAKAATGTRVAIKQIKERQRSWEACLSMRELRSLKSMGKHPNLVALKELVLDKDILNFVFEFLPRNLHQVIQEASHGFSDSRVAHMSSGLLRGVAHMHSRGAPPQCWRRRHRHHSPKPPRPPLPAAARSPHHALGSPGARLDPSRCAPGRRFHAP